MSTLARGAMWLSAVLAVAAAVHVASLLAVPRGIMMLTMAKISERSGLNTMAYGERPTAASRGVVRPSPDLLYASCVYDLAKAGGMLRIRAADMPHTYWSVSLFDADTDNFYVVNDRQAKGGVDFVLIGPGADKPAAGTVVRSPTTRGIVLFRTLIDDEAHLAAIDAGRRHATCAPYHR